MATIAETDIQRAEKLWFSPDVVILRAQTRVFRVFVAILKEKSSVFADMFTFPQPPSSDIETMDGVPVVTLHDDPDAMEVFLKAIFDSEFFMPPPAECKFDDIIGILRLAHKYDVPYLRRRALEHLGPIYPTRLSEFDSHRKLLPRRLQPWGCDNRNSHRISQVIVDPRWLALGENERNAYLRGHSVQMLQVLKICKFLSTSSDEDNCEDSAQCNRLRLRINSAHIDRIFSSQSIPLTYWGNYSWDAMKDRGMCTHCITMSRSLHTAARENLWNELPEMFGLPAWEELEQMRQVALTS
ncbi:BTB domain-containing protein [Mycena venus]|uniref:BTB domain-containing protein n=1 Tax=Mycena venus TaxID=2733690 RepID=A0A8H6YDP2_9AGAR|nr:BTB domain-containing protein [Mycena venus]